MKAFKRSMLAMTMLLASGALSAAWSEPATVAATPQNPSAFLTNEAAPLAPRKSLQWDANGRWTLKLDMDQPVGREMELKDMSAGAYFHITPSMRIGGSVGLADRFADEQKVAPQDTVNAPRVRLETKFKF
jgi:hypothetical protein